MSTHSNHHYVPVFLLKQWAGADRKLSVFKRLPNGKLRHDRLGPKSVACDTHVYSLRRSSSEPDTRIERDFLGPQVDNLAAAVHAQMLKTGIGSLTPAQRVVWSRFLMAALLRAPLIVEDLRSFGRTELHIVLETISPQPAEMDSLMREPRLSDMLDDHGMGTFLKAITSEKHIRWLCDSTWSLVQLPSDSKDALICDYPVAYFGELMDNRFALVTPLSPRCIFICASNADYQKKLGWMQARELSKRINKRLVQHADQYVYSTNRQHEALIAKYLGG